MIFVVYKEINIMKKSKIIVPALAMIAFSAAASIAGSVAWFTASRQVTVDAGTYAVVKTNASLDCVVSAGAGTTVNDKVVTLGNNKLTDGSFSHLNSNIYTPNENGNGFSTVTGKGEIALVNYTSSTTSEAKAAFEALLERGDVGTGSSAGKIYTAVTFELAFTVSFGAVDADVGLFLDNGASKTSFVVAGENPPAASTAKGFRMAFIPYDVPTGSAGHATVLADLQTTANCRYVGSKDSFPANSATPGAPANGAAYNQSSATDLIDSSYATALPTSATERATAIARPDYLGTFKFSSGNRVTLKYTAVAWFEGTDPEIINRLAEEDYQAVKASLCFEAVTLKAAA